MTVVRAALVLAVVVVGVAVVVAVADCTSSMKPELPGVHENNGPPFYRFYYIGNPLYRRCPTWGMLYREVFIREVQRIGLALYRESPI